MPGIPWWVWALGGVAVVGAIAVTVGKGKTPPPPTKSGLDFLSYDTGLNDFLATLGSYYLADDGFYVSRGNFGSVADPAEMNAMAAQLKAVLPTAEFVAMTGGTPNAQDLATAGLSGDFGRIAMDWEPSEPGFDGTQAGTLAALKNFADVVHAHGYLAVGYMSGQGLGHLQWQYGELMTGSGLDGMTVETQEAVAGGGGPAAVDTLVAQFKAAGANVAQLECQATVGVVASGKVVTTQEVVDTYNEAMAQGMQRFFLEFAGSTEADLLAVLQALGR